MFKKYTKVLNTKITQDDKVLLVYCCCDDIVEASLEKCFKQNYRNFDVVILDDSRKEEEKIKVDNFAKKHNIKVVRRPNREGFKAGNINNYLNSDECKQLKYDYFVILDSDEIIPKNFIESSLKYFYTYDNVGVVQANHISTKNKNFFMNLFHIGVNSHWPVYQSMKHYFGFSTMLGHGAMIKAECFYKLDSGFPHLVAEDICISIELRSLGYYVAFAPEIICEEEYPVDYVAFKKRHSKWTQGNVEFIKKYTKKIFMSKMKWFEKLDIVLFTFNLPLTALFSLYIIINIVAAPFIGLNLTKIYPVWFLIPTVLFFLAPTLNDIIYWIFRMNIFKFILYLFSTVVLYGSMLTISLLTSFLVLVGKKAKFVVTPKKTSKYKFFDIFRYQWKELLFAVAISAISYIFLKSVLPVILIVLTAILPIFLIFFSNIKIKNYMQKDQKTAKISINKMNNVFKKTCNVDLNLLSEYETQNFGQPVE
ncbi:glycosyltransferase family 2 protein [Mycoplasmopsis bovigenitalium]|nr:glycosyltransferase family 2 protein [Mycoplasmopsis bovigenitalium]